jgi:hypothetical protein
MRGYTRLVDSYDRKELTSITGLGVIFVCHVMSLSKMQPWSQDLQVLLDYLRG